MVLQTAPGGTWVSGCFRGEPGDGKVVDVMSGRHRFRTPTSWSLPLGGEAMPGQFSRSRIGSPASRGRVDKFI